MIAQALHHAVWFTTLKRHWLGALAICLTVGVIISVLTLRQQSLFQAACKIEFASSAPEVNLDSRTLWRYSSYVLQNLFLNSQQIIMTSDPVMQRVVTSLKLADPLQEPEKFARIQQSLAGAVSIERINESQIFIVRARHPDAKMAMDIANTTAEAYIRYTYEKKVENYKTSVDWIDEKLVDLKAKLELSQRALVEFIEREKITSLPAVPEGDKSNAMAEMLPFPEARESESLLATLRARKVEEEFKLERLNEKYLPAHPEYQKTQAEIALLDRKIHEEEGQLNGLKHNYEKELIRRKGKEVEYSILSREVEVNKEIYNALIRKHKESDIGTSIAQTDASIIERAELPRVSVYPRKPLQVLLGWMLGLLAAIGYCFLRDFTDTSLKSPRDVEAHLKIPLLSTVHFDRELEAQPPDKLRIMVKDEDPHLGEAFRVLRTNLNFSFPKGEHGRVMMVGSTNKGEGKSTVTMNLAKVTAELNRRTLLIDGDLRARSLSKHFNHEAAVGLTSYLIGESSLQEVCVPTGVNNLWLIPAGQVPPQPSTLLDSQEMRNLLIKLRDEYDEIIIDSPPVGLVIDSIILAAMVDAIVVVVEAAKSSYHDVARALAAITKVNAKICGLVLNKYRAHNAKYPYGKGYYGYYDAAPKKVQKKPTPLVAVRDSASKS